MRLLTHRLQVRRLTAVDAEALSALCTEHAAFERAAPPPAGHAGRLAACLNSQDIVAFGAEDAWGALRGYASLTVDVSTWRAAAYAHLDCLYLSAGFRGAGHGRALLAAACDHALAAGLAMVEWQTPAWNTRAQRFYESLGASAATKQRFALSLQAGLKPGR